MLTIPDAGEQKAAADVVDRDAWTPCKLCDAADFFRPELIAQLKRVGEAPRLHGKQWELAQLLECWDRYGKPGGTAVGLGCGCEPTLPLLAASAGEVIATDLYDVSSAWSTARHTPEKAFPGARNLRSHRMNMLRVDLPEKSADFVWSLCAIEHVGGPDDVCEAIRQAGRLLRPGGHLFFSTEFNIGPTRDYRTSTTLFLDEALVERVIRSSGLFLVEPIRIELTPHPMNAPVSQHVVGRYNFLPHVVFRHQRNPWSGTYTTIVSAVLSHEDRKVPIFDRRNDPLAVVESLASRGREANFRLAGPWNWWI
jgi:SAM-dependent methyltransferase